MILQSLARYYNILAADPKYGIAPPGYSVANVSFALNLSERGELVEIFPLYKSMQQGSKTVEVPRRTIVPEQVKRGSGVAANFLCDNSAYILGLSAKDAKDPEYASKRFDAFRLLNIDLLVRTNCTEAEAVIAFLGSYDPNTGKDNPIIARHLKYILEGGNLVFMMMGTFVHENIEIRKVWETYKAAGGKYVGQCLVTGVTAPIARLHPRIKGIREAKSAGATLVGFNARAYESYNRTDGQGLNSPVSESAAFAYTTALNYLLSPENENKKFTIGDTTVVYWAESNNDKYAATIISLFQPDLVEKPWEDTENRSESDKNGEERLGEIADRVKRAGTRYEQRMLEGLDGSTSCHILGLVPNVGRIAVRFFHTDSFDMVVQKFMKHYADLQIVKEYDDQPTYLSIRRVLDETVSKKAKDPKASPLMAAAVFRSILGNTPYPAALYYAILNRIRADQNLNYERTAVIKAYLTRKYRNQPNNHIQDVLCMALNEQSTYPAYLLGRLFAVLEKAQKDAAVPIKLNSTIKDRHFASACASPASVFPVLLRLSHFYISKAEYGYVSDKRIKDIMNLLDIGQNPFPARLSLDEHGIFVLGYYHQRVAFFKPKYNKTDAELSVSGKSAK